MEAVEWASSNNPEILARLRAHPRIICAEEGPDLLAFSRGNWLRTIHQGPFSSGLFGVVELIDNNPLVCADEFTLPNEVTGLALIAFQPLVNAGIVLETPVVLSSREFNQDDLAGAFKNLGWNQGVIASCESQPSSSTTVVSVLTELPAEITLDDLHGLFEECYGRSFYVRLASGAVLPEVSILGSASAHYRLKRIPDESRCLANISIIAEKDGKFGPSGVIHAMNIMGGFEESLGIQSSS